MSAPATGILVGMGDHGPSIKRDDVYEALRRKGYSKTKAARISNAVANGTNGHGVRGKAGGGRKGGGRRSGVAATAGRRGTASKATSRGTKGRGRRR